MSTSSMTPEDLRAAAEVHSELGPGYRDAVVDSFLSKVGQEIDARVDARVALADNGTRQRHSPDNALRLAVASLIFGIPISAIVTGVGHDPAGVWGLIVVWAAIAVINVAYSLHSRPPGRR